MAISVSKEEEEETLSTFLGDKNGRVGFDDEIEKIKYFLTHPVVTDWNIDDFLVYLEGISYMNDFSVYKNVHKEEFKLSDVLYDLRRGWIGEIKPKIKMDHQQLFDMVQSGGVSNVYLRQLKNYFSIYGENGKMPLGGGCGGDDVSENDLDPLTGIRFNPLSTNYRLKTLTIEDIMKKNGDDSDEYGSLKFSPCPVCNGEHTRPRHVLLEVCPDKKSKNGESIPIPKC